MPSLKKGTQKRSFHFLFFAGKCCRWVDSVNLLVPILNALCNDVGSYLIFGKESFQFQKNTLK